VYPPSAAVPEASRVLNFPAMSFSVRIAADLVSVEAGATVPLGIEIANRSDEQDRYELEIEGLDPDWTAVPVPTFAVDARDIQSEKVFFKPPRVSESLSGTYPFVVKVRSLVSGEQRTAQGVLEIRPYHHLTMELLPKKGMYSPVKKSNQFQATVMNLGNTAHTLQLFASDPEDALAYEFENGQIALAPGQTRTVAVTAKPTGSRPFAGSRLFGFNVTARSSDAPGVACSSQAQLEERPLFAPATIVMVLLTVLLFALWLALLPKPPRLDSLSIRPPDPIRGSQVTVSWTASNANSVRLSVGNIQIEGKPNDSYTFTANQDGVIVATAVREGKTSDAVTRAFTVVDPPATPDPVIEQFDVTPKEAKLGEPLLVRYKLSGQIEEAKLEPVNMNLDPDLETVRITADLLGTVTYRLVATNSAGKSVNKSVKVTVVKGSEASIVVFKVEPKTLPAEGGQVTVSWQLENARRIELQAGPEQLVLEGASGQRYFIVTETTEFVIIGYDAQGLTVTRKERVVVQPTPSTDPPPPTNSSGGDGAR
jgi:hypothetical protein